MSTINSNKMQSSKVQRDIFQKIKSQTAKHTVQSCSCNSTRHTFQNIVREARTGNRVQDFLCAPASQCVSSACWRRSRPFVLNLVTGSSGTSSKW